MKKVKIKDISIYLNRGISPKYSKAGYIVINQRCIRDYKIDLINIKYSCYQRTRLSNDKRIRKWDALINSTGVGTLGRVAQWKKCLENITVDSHVTIARPDLSKVNGAYYGYAIKAKQSVIESLGKGATGQTELSRHDLGEILIPMYTLQTQRKIASILSAYDELIENNTRRIKILEEMAQRIYREWFVDFRFPGHEKVKFVDSKLGKIPEKTRIVKFGDLVDIKKGKKAAETFTSSDHDRVPYLLIKFFDDTYSNYVNKEKMLLVTDDEVLMVMDGARSGLVALSDIGAVGSTIACFRSKGISNFYLYHFLKYHEDVIRSKNTGAAIPHANKDFINLMDVAIVSDEIVKEFEKTVESVYHLKRKLRAKIKNLRKTIDILLPKLISGEIDVSKMDIAIQECENDAQKQ